MYYTIFDKKSFSSPLLNLSFLSLPNTFFLSISLNKTMVFLLNRNNRYLTNLVKSGVRVLKVQKCDSFERPSMLFPRFPLWISRVKTKLFSSVLK
jgi:hypothetical protein